MKLVSCYITNFGKISEFEYRFEEGFNPILQENGWGKTTFSVFIKSMFYGMEYSPTKRKELMDRNHYLPWNGGVCGGNIVFTAKGKTYRVERTFGKTDKDDTFSLYDEETGLLSNDYTANLGEELFLVDRESFVKSVYVPQSDISTKMTDSLNAKMGNLSSAKDDISNFDAALKAVKDAKTEYTRNSKINPGKLIEVKHKLSKAKEEYEKFPAILEGFDGQNCLLEEKQEKLNQLLEQKEQLSEKINVQSKREQELGAYKSLKDNLQKEKDGLKELDEFFINGIPSVEALEDLENKDRSLEVMRQTVEEKKNALPINVFPKPFENGIPTDEQISGWSRLATILSELRSRVEHAKLSVESIKQLEELKFFFSKMVPTDEEVSDLEKKTASINHLDGRIGEANERVMLLKAQKEALSKNTNPTESTMVGNMLAIVLFLVLLAGGIVFTIYNVGPITIILRMVFYLASAAVLAIFLFTKKKKVNDSVKELDAITEELDFAEEQLEGYMKNKAELETECGRFLSHFLLTRAETMQENVYEIRRKLDQYNHLMEEEKNLSSSVEGTLDELADAQLSLHTYIQPYATAYGLNLYEAGNELEFLTQLKQDADTYRKYDTLQKEITQLTESIKKTEAEVSETLKKFPVHAIADKNEKIKEIRSKVERYDLIEKRVQELEESIKSFEDGANSDELAESVEELQVKQRDLDQEIMDLNKLITQDREKINAEGEEIERLSDIGEQIERLELLEEEYKDKAEILALTADYLQEARESFLSKYMAPLQNGLKKYLSLINRDSTEGYPVDKFELDMDLGVKLDYSGSTKSADYLSAGIQDMVALCSRLALVDVLYSDEKPILILDDPFTNLDRDKIEESLKLVKEISKDRQTIYFTCHESRI